RNGHRDHLRYNLLTAQYHLPSLITFAETADHLHRNPHSYLTDETRLGQLQMHSFENTDL
ncbi:hypothetical protein, partial [Ralstonia pickettii]|uniref:hypothetical protein n=1 Tax=Ralstonia pickettii TaxID=329 RepID=UPI001C12B857